MSKVCPTCGNAYGDASIFCPSDGSTLRPADDSGDLVGTVIADRYLIMSKLGEGGMGRVYLAQHVRLPQQAAIKVLSPALVNDTEALARFNREASNACRINAEHVARVYDFGETGTGLVYLAMEYVPGATLSSLLKTEGSLAPARAANLTSQVAEGLEAAHRLGIVHRDLKPDNILVTSEPDGTELAKVVDFGIAKAIDGNGQSVTRAGIVLGTAQFMSPEQVIGHVTDRRTDVYALGLVAFMMLTGKLPFEADTAEEAMFKRLSEPPKTLAEERPDVAWPPRLQAVLDKALARELNDRYATASELARELSAAVEEWQRQPAGALASATSPRPRRALLVGVGAAALAAVIASLVLARGDDEGAVARSRATDSAGSTTQSGAVVVAGDSGLRDTSAGRTSAVVSPPSNVADGQPASRTAAAAPPARRPVAQRPEPAGGSAAIVDRSRPTDSEARAADAVRARAELDRIVEGLDPEAHEITSETARNAILKLGALLPRLATAQDTVKAELHRAGAYIFLDQKDQSCSILRGLARTAPPRFQDQIRAQREALGCE